MEGDMSNYKVFYTDQALPGSQEPDYAFLLPLEFGSEEEALKEAFKIIYHGATVWRIERPDGYYLDRAAVEHRYKQFKSG
jgi:hypothetical protein